MGHGHERPILYCCSSISRSQTSENSKFSNLSQAKSMPSCCTVLWARMTSAVDPPRRYDIVDRPHLEWVSLACLRSVSAGEHYCSTANRKSMTSSATGSARVSCSFTHYKLVIKQPEATQFPFGLSGESLTHALLRYRCVHVATRRRK